MNSNSNAAAISNYYHDNKQKQAYMDDDLVSDYSTVIRNSRIQASTSPKLSNERPPRPSIPLDMDLIASSPRLSTLVERQGSISSVQSIHDNNILAQQQQQRRELQLQQQRQLQEQQLRQPKQQQEQQQHQLQLQQQQRQQQRPISHQVQAQPQRPLHSNDSNTELWKRNTINNIKSQQEVSRLVGSDCVITQKES
jgi:hypothetical protein